MTDSEGYAKRLREKFTYQNTYFHAEPKLDISAAEMPPDRIGQYDFVISSEIFEHVVPPVHRAFINTRTLLKPGGVFVLSVPYAVASATVEHFPDLHASTLVAENGPYRLRNVTKEGLVQEFTNLIFHGGPGSTLEMRLFAESDLLRHLKGAGFSDIKVHASADLAHGIWWPAPCSFPLTAKKPLVDAVTVVHPSD